MFYYYWQPKPSSILALDFKPPKTNFIANDSWVSTFKHPSMEMVRFKPQQGLLMGIRNLTILTVRVGNPVLYQKLKTSFHSLHSPLLNVVAQFLTIILFSLLPAILLRLTPPLPAKRKLSFKDIEVNILSNINVLVAVRIIPKRELYAAF